MIAHKDVPVDTLKKRVLLDFFTGDIKTWKGGGPVVVIDLKPKTATKKQFYKFLGKSSSRMKSIWMKKMLSGEGDPPQSFATEDEILAKIKMTSGAIGFVSRAKVNGDVKILLEFTMPVKK